MQDTAVVSACLGIVLLTSVILFAVSFDTIEPTEIGLLYNSINVKVEEETYGNGRYFVGLGKKFIKFPLTLILIDFNGPTALRAWSKEGQLVTIDLNIEYKLNRTGLHDLWRKYDEDYNSRLRNKAVQAIKKITIQYEAVDFFEKRDEIGYRIEQSVKEKFAEENLRVWIVNMRKITLPFEFEQKIIDKVVEEQNLQIAKNKADIVLVQAKISVITGDGDAQVNEILQFAEAAADQIQQDALSIGKRDFRQAESDAYKSFAQTLDLGREDILRYLWSIKQLETTRNQLIGLDTPIISSST